MTVSELIGILRNAPQESRVAFLTWGADEAEIEEVVAVAMPGCIWTCAATGEGGRSTSRPSVSQAPYVQKRSNVVPLSVSLVVLGSDEDILTTRRFRDD